VGHLAAGEVEQEDVGVAGPLAQALGRDEAPVGGDRCDLAPATELEDLLVARTQVARDDVEVDAVPSVRPVREQRTVTSDVRRSTTAPPSSRPRC
jgi:hypothetical protein